MSSRKKLYKQLALLISLALILLWITLGTSASLAWFTDTSDPLKNIFHLSGFDLVVSHKTDDGSYEELNGQTKVFDDEALYEPGYTQIVYLKVENRGELDFRYKTAVNVTDYTPGTNVFGNRFNLQDHLRFGLVTAATESELQQKLADRDLAKSSAALPLNNYTTEYSDLAAGDEEYMALIVRMPEEVGNEANYRFDVVPKVELGLVVNAAQKTS